MSEFILNPLADGDIDPKISDFLVASRYVSEYLNNVTLTQVHNLKIWGLLPPGVKSHDMDIDAISHALVYTLHLKSGKKLPESAVEEWLKPLSKAAQLLLGDTWEITWKRAKKTLYRQARRKPFLVMEPPEVP